MANSKLVNVIELLILISAGFLLILHPGGSLHVAVRVLGFALLAYGGIAVVGSFLKSQEDRSIVKLIVGALSAVGGIIVLVSPEFILSIFPIAAGLMIAVGGVRDLLTALEIKQEGFDGWKLALLLALITIAFGILIFANPFGTMETLAVILGVALIYDGVAGIFTVFRTR